MSHLVEKWTFGLFCITFELKKIIALASLKETKNGKSHLERFLSLNSACFVLLMNSELYRKCYTVLKGNRWHSQTRVLREAITDCTERNMHGVNAVTWKSLVLQQSLLVLSARVEMKGSWKCWGGPVTLYLNDVSFTDGTSRHSAGVVARCWNGVLPDCEIFEAEKKGAF